jgi:hypothetical protein
VTDPTAKAFQIFGALHAAGLLQNNGATSSADLVGALRAAGLLQTAAPTPLTAPGAPKVGDVVAPEIDWIQTMAEPTVEYCLFGGGGNTYGCAFPPNNSAFLPEIAKLMAATNPLLVGIAFKISTIQPQPGYVEYTGTMISLAVTAWCVPH